MAKHMPMPMRGMPMPTRRPPPPPMPAAPQPQMAPPQMAPPMPLHAAMGTSDATPPTPNLFPLPLSSVLTENAQNYARSKQGRDNGYGMPGQHNLMPWDVAPTMQDLVGQSIQQAQQATEPQAYFHPEVVARNRSAVMNTYPGLGASTIYNQDMSGAGRSPPGYGPRHIPTPHYAGGTSDATPPAPGQTITNGSWTGPQPTTPPPTGTGGQNGDLRQKLNMRGVPRLNAGSSDVGGEKTMPNPTSGEGGYNPQMGNYNRPMPDMNDRSAPPLGGPPLDDHFVAHLRAAMGMAPKVQHFKSGTANAEPFDSPQPPSFLDRMMGGGVNIPGLQIGSPAARRDPEPVPLGAGPMRDGQPGGSVPAPTGFNSIPGDGGAGWAAIKSALGAPQSMLPDSHVEKGSPMAAHTGFNAPVVNGGFSLATMLGQPGQSGGERGGPMTMAQAVPSQGGQRGGPTAPPPAQGAPSAQWELSAPAQGAAPAPMTPAQQMAAAPAWTEFAGNQGGAGPTSYGGVENSGWAVPQHTFGSMLQQLTGLAPSHAVHNNPDGSQTVKTPTDPKMVDTVAKATGAPYAQTHALLEPQQYSEDEFVNAVRGMPVALVEKLWNMHHYLNPQQQAGAQYAQHFTDEVSRAQADYDAAKAKGGTPAATLEAFRKVLVSARSNQLDQQKSMGVPGQGLYYQDPNQTQ